MTAKKLSAVVGCLLLVGTVAAQAQGKYQVTDAERAACGEDAVNLCSAAYPDEDALIACMKLNVAKLTAGCRPVFIQGLRRRGLR